MFNPTHTLNELYILTKLNWRKHALMLLIYALYVVLMHYTTYNAALSPEKISIDSYHLLTTIPLIILTMVITLDVFKQLRDPVGSIQYLLTPSSAIDKTLATWTYSFLMVFVSFVLVYNASHLLSVIVLNNFTTVHFSVFHEAKALPLATMSPTGMPFLFQNWQEVKELTLFFMGTHASFLLGSAFFRKNPFLKTVMVLIGLSILKGIGAYLLLKAFGVDTLVKTQSHTELMMKLPESLEKTLNGINDFMTVALPLLAWYLTYEVLKRKQV